MTMPRQIEQRSIDYIPESERHGNPRSLFFVWFAANTSITAVVTGALFVILGNSALWAIPAIIIGNILGGFVTSLHSAQGPKLGVPQMIQSRAQFGYYGAILPLVLALMIYLGFYATGLVLGGQAIGDLFHVSTQFGAAIFALLSTALAIFGYRYIHRFSKFAAVLSGVVFIVLLLSALTTPDASQLIRGTDFAMAPFVLGISLAASWQLTFGPYIADYSRYLPRATSQKAIMGWTFAGSVLGGSLAMIVGAVAAAVGGPSFSGNQVGYLATLGGQLGWLVLLAVICGKLTGDTLSAYGGFMSMATIVTSLTNRPLVGLRARTIYIVLISAAALAIALAASDNFLSSFTNFLLFLLYFMTPWSAINLVDFYLVRREKYNVEALFRADGEYGRVNAVAFIAYFAGVLIQVPFMNSPLYVGPIANWLGGAEVAWIIGLLVSGAIYWAFAPARLARGGPALLPSDKARAS
ncbi:cytosine permease [Leifsonia sp. YAF41]|uniref:purine-cytosine permease family protein n=1 Tax=Leifsonia sp. YAF41 TaxID=3233086 RepID=UPI003F9A1AC0